MFVGGVWLGCEGGILVMKWRVGALMEVVGFLGVEVGTYSWGGVGDFGLAG